MPAYCRPSPMYEAYCKWCIEARQQPPTREWWDNSCNQSRQPTRKLTDNEFDDETEQRDGWAR